MTSCSKWGLQQCQLAMQRAIVISRRNLSWQAAQVLFYNKSLAAVIDRVQIAAILSSLLFHRGPTLAQDRRLNTMQCMCTEPCMLLTVFQCTVWCTGAHWCTLVGATKECSRGEVCADNPEKLLLIILLLLILLHFQYFFFLLLPMHFQYFIHLPFFVPPSNIRNELWWKTVKKIFQFSQKIVLSVFFKVYFCKVYVPGLSIF